MIKLTYQGLYQMNKIEARKTLLNTLKDNNFNISRTARILECSRNTVKKFMRRSCLDDLSRKPRYSPRQTPEDLEELVEKERKKTNYGRIRLAKHLESEYKVRLSSHTIRNILHRRGLKKQSKKRGRFKAVTFYDWDILKPLEHFQIDLKEILDLKTLPYQVYRHAYMHQLPRYQWTALDVYTRIKFIAYSKEKTLANGIVFFVLIHLWIRSYGIDHKLFFQTDWGEEFGGKSIDKLLRLQKEILDPLGIQLLRIRKRRWQDNGFVERTHRTDDEEFYVPHLSKIKDLDQHFRFALKWVYRFNCQRAHFGKHMDSKTPYQRLREKLPHIDEKFCLFFCAYFRCHLLW